MTNFATLQRVDLRNGWIDEARDFTPWLAECDNLRMLGDTIGLQLECEAVEKPVGPFSADILCRDTATGSWVLIENQLERTDHIHLGQLITYAAGLKAATIVWVARQFREEHRAAIDWLNEITTEEYSFFGIEIELWQIASSPMAPKFNVVCKPNDWSREVRESAKEVGELSEGQQLQRKYWSAFMDHLRENGRTNTPKPLAQYWMTFPVGRSGVRISCVASAYNNRLQTYQTCELRVELLMDGLDAPAIITQLEQRRKAIEDALAPDVVNWDNREGLKMRRVFILRDAPICEPDDWPAQHAWLREKLQKFEQVFRPIVAELGRASE